jgi:hypothetical protein
VKEVLDEVGVPESELADRLPRCSAWAGGRHGFGGDHGHVVGGGGPQGRVQGGHLGVGVAVLPPVWPAALIEMTLPSEVPSRRAATEAATPLAASLSEVALSWARSFRMSLAGSGNCGAASSGSTTVSPRPFVPCSSSGRMPYAASRWRAP